MRRKNKLNIEIGSKLQNARLAKGFTQEEVAEKVDCSSRYLGQLETNRTQGSIDLIIELCNLYGITLNDLYSSYLNFDYSNADDKLPNIIGYDKLNSEYRAIIDNTINFLNTMQNQKNRNKTK